MPAFGDMRLGSIKGRNLNVVLRPLPERTIIQPSLATALSRSALPLKCLRSGDFFQKTILGVTMAQSLLSSSAQGAKYLILLQVGSRALTFAVNQVLLRYLSPELLGISTQLELYSITVLYFARESLRVALQRQSGSSEDAKGDGANTKRTQQHLNRYLEAESPAGRTQTVVNMAYLSIFLGIPLAFGLAKWYLKSASRIVLSSPGIHQSVYIYGFAAILELVSEPAFAVVQQNMLYKTRATAETIATVSRCLVTCVMAVRASKTGEDWGVLPFAGGQMSYAIALTLYYYLSLSTISRSVGFSLYPRSLFSSTQTITYYLTYISSPLLTLSTSLFIQCAIKHILTQGDSLLIASLASLADQGAYALASNYGGLIARMLFQPIEESSRNLFAKLLTVRSNSKPDTQGVKAASEVLRDILRLYMLLSVVAAALGPTVAPLLLKIVAGERWAKTSAADVLATYCYYIPLLAINGVTEAFISSVATNAQLYTQSMVMFAFSLGFASAGFVFLRVLGWGAQGLVWANVVNMLLRIIWSLGFIRHYLRVNGGKLKIREVLPTAGSIASGAGAAAVLIALKKSFKGGSGDYSKSAAVAGPFGLLL
ncbi:MAG: Oligosaccharide translocation protein rft1 [Candelina mexicana]|nr:MAG: Oligosaccharide translocation protein rft1 [Candelina mexicana]